MSLIRRPRAGHRVLFLKKSQTQCWELYKQVHVWMERCYTAFHFLPSIRNLVPLYKMCFKLCGTLHFFLHQDSHQKTDLRFQGHQTGRGTWHYKAIEREITFPWFWQLQQLRFLSPPSPSSSFCLNRCVWSMGGCDVMPEWGKLCKERISARFWIMFLSHVLKEWLN